MKKYRFVEDGDDGHVLYQCLACKEYLPAAGNYCMECGVKFDGPAECRPRNCPAWAWKLWGCGWEDKFYAHSTSRPQRPKPGRWLLEGRWLYEGRKHSDWTFVAQSSEWHDCSARQFYESQRDDLTGSVFTDCTVEYRFVRITQSGRSFSRTIVRTPQRIAAESVS